MQFRFRSVSVSDRDYVVLADKCCGSKRLVHILVPKIITQMLLVTAAGRRRPGGSGEFHLPDWPALEKLPLEFDD